MRLCGVQGCERRHNAHGLCLAHYRRRRKGVEVATPIRERQTLLEAFWSRVNVAGDCWLWTGRPTAQGYGAIHWGGRHITAHRLSVEIHSGPIQDGLQVDHVCRNRLCVRPEHLRVVTDGENKQNLGVYANSSTGVRGVSYYPKRGKFLAYAQRGGKRHYLGWHLTLESADRAAAEWRRANMPLSEMDKLGRRITNGSHENRGAELGTGQR